MCHMHHCNTYESCLLVHLNTTFPWHGLKFWLNFKFNFWTDAYKLSVLVTLNEEILHISLLEVAMYIYRSMSIKLPRNVNNIKTLLINLYFFAQDFETRAFFVHSCSRYLSNRFNLIRNTFSPIIRKYAPISRLWNSAVILFSGSNFGTWLCSFAQNCLRRIALNIKC